MKKTKIPLNLKKLFKKPLFDLGEKNLLFSGIYSPKYDKKEIKRFMSSYYESVEGAHSQDKSFDLRDYYFAQITRALNKVGFNQKKKNLQILEVGSGFGSATFPLFKLFPKAQIIASDLSASMLIVLKEKLAKQKKKVSCELLQLNAEELDFKENSFDLIAGAAILHHLFTPQKAIKAILKILKPGGVAIFFEPFEEGTSLMALIYKAIINNLKFLWLDRSNKTYFRHMVAIWQKMKNTDKSDPFLQTVDDKWIFKKSYFQKFSKQADFQNVLIYRLDNSERPFTNLAHSHFGERSKTMPKWIFETISEYEKWLSNDLKDELITEGCIIFQKKKSIKEAE